MKKLFSILVILTLIFVTLGIDASSVAYAESKIVDTVVNKDSEVTVIVELNHTPPEFNAVATDDLEKNQELLREKRDANKAYFSEKNNDVVGAYVERFVDVWVSEYSPYVFITFADYDDYCDSKATIVEMSRHSAVKSVFVEDQLELTPASTKAESESSTSLEISDAIEMINADTATRRGTGITIGIIDEECPESWFTDWKHDDYPNGYTTYGRPHTTQVAAIIGGDYGIASGADLYVHPGEDNEDNYVLNEAVEYLLGCYVNVINISMAFGDFTAVQGRRDGYSAYLDYIIWQNQVIIVTVSGNERTYLDSVVNSGMGTNVITVGATNAEGKVANWSLHEIDSSLSGILQKPTLVAPGENIIIRKKDGTVHSTASGTSYAAPLVAGVVALLMEEFPRYVYQPEIIMSALIASAADLADQTTIWDPYAGAGLVDYEAARAVLSSSNYVNTIITTESTTSAVVLSRTVVVPAYSCVELALVTLHNSAVTTPSNTIIAPSFTKYTMMATGSSGPVIMARAGSSSNVSVAAIYNNTNSSQTYTISIRRSGSKVGTYDEYMSLAAVIRPHVHDYKQWVYYDSSSHIEKCICGLEGTVTASHVVRRTDIVDNTAPCLECGRILDLSLDYAEIIVAGNGAIKYSVNGSFMFPSGNVVLVDADIDAYFVGTLRFYAEKDLPTQM